MLRIHMLEAEDGDCLLVETGASDKPFRILIDGGRRSTTDRLLALLACLGGPAIDLLVLTHVDGDHIEGMIALAGGETPFPVGELWFNGVNHTRIAAGAEHVVRTWPPPAAAAGGPPRDEAQTLSARQAITFARAVAKRGWPWNKAFQGGPAMIADTELPGVDLPGMALPCGGRIVLLGPPRKKLAAFHDEIDKAFRELGGQAGDVLSDTPLRPIGSVTALADRSSTPDNARANGASIAFVVESDGKRVLFGADAHPDDLSAAVRRYAPGTAPVRFDAVKVPHHGSARNNTKALLSVIESPLWLVSTDGSRNHHPHPQAIARIVLAGSPGKELVFNYRSPYNAVWDAENLKQRHDYRTRYLVPGDVVDV